jgi:hypothetical protein
MPLDTPGLKKDILSILKNMNERTENPEQAMEAYSEKMANAITKFVLTGEVNVSVVTAGSPNAHTGTGTGKVT